MKTLTSVIALSIVAGGLATVTASAAPVIRTTPVETAQKAETVGYYGGYYNNYYYFPKPRYNYYYNYGYGY